jgi:hypothetical protein
MFERGMQMSRCRTVNKDRISGMKLLDHIEC